MDPRVKLINQVSKDLLDTYEHIEDAKFKILEEKVTEYSNIFEDVVRNFYELETMDDDCPLFKLCYYIREGKENFGMDQAEYDAEIKSLVNTTNKLFGSNL